MVQRLRGKQYWNDDGSEGYELTEDIVPCTPILSRQFKPLGAAAIPKAGEFLPSWLTRKLREEEA